MILLVHSQTQASIHQICHALELPRISFYHTIQAAATRPRARIFSLCAIQPKNYRPKTSDGRG